MPVPPLPSELIIEILECIHDTLGRRSPGYKTLASCALVCTSWAPVAQSILFRTVQETTKPKWTSHIIRALKDNPNLGSYVRILDVDVYYHEFADYISLTSFVSILSSCPRLFKLNLGFRLAWLHASTLEELARLSSLKITTIKWNGGSAVIYQLVELWARTIRFLDLEQTHSLPRSPRSTRPPLNLHQLILSSSVMDRDSLLWFLPLPVQDPEHILPRLRVLELSSYWHDQHHIAVAQNPWLYSLTLGAGVPPNPESYTSLEELVIRQLPPARAGAIILPHGITHFGFHPRSGTQGRDSLRDVIIPALHVLVHLRHISVNHHVSQDNVAALRDVCSRKGAHLTVYTAGYEAPFPKDFRIAAS